MKNDNSVAAQQFRARMVQRAIQQKIPMLALSLSRYVQAEGLTWRQLADSLNCSEDSLNRVALCNPPRQARFQEDVRAIAEGRADYERLFLLLRRLQILEAWSVERADAERSFDEAVHEATEQILLAARDREDADEPQESETEHD